VLHCNARLGQLLQRPAEELIGRSFSSFVHPGDISKWESAFGATGGPPPVGFTLQVLVNDRRPMPVHVALCSLGQRLEPIAFLVASDLVWQEERTRQLERLNRELQRQREALEVAATTDSTTGAYSSGAVFEVLETEIAYGGRYSYPVSALLMDIDHFKSLNDSYGHAFGDHVLREFCDRCREAIRGTDYLVRYGGDEFLVILPQTGRSGARAVAGRILGGVRSQMFGGDERDVPVTVSIGAATATPDEHIPASELLKQADEALYEVKHAGRDGFASWGKRKG
jgi:diguanylate cyclase (GGDEF)-like protein